ncbi:MAG: DUF4295 family protein [Saprospiraceae bacterium]|nr:DUF4295 family protein [Saprospiraceae bacterium]
MVLFLGCREIKIIIFNLVSHGKSIKERKVAQRAANVGSGRDFVKVVKSVKDPKTGRVHLYKELMIHKDKVKEFFEKK